MSANQDDYNKGGFIAFLFSVAFCCLFFIYISFIHPGVDLGEIEEQAAAKADAVLAGGTAAPKIAISSVEKPWEPNEGVVQHGLSVYKTNCAICHGPTGAGDGAAAAGLNPPVRNLIKGGWKNGGTSIALFKTLQNGIAGGSMASFKHLPKADRWALVQYIRSITEDKPEDDPAALEAFAQSAE